jgi:hypothetical protein
MSSVARTGTETVTGANTSARKTIDSTATLPGKTRQKSVIELNR